MDERESVFELNEQDIDAAWDEDVETHIQQEEPPEPEAQPPVEEGKQDPPAAPPQNDNAAGDKEPSANQPQDTFTLKHLEETKTVNRDEVVVLAQKGMDYDRIRQERDQLREYRQGADPALNLVKAYAERNGMDIGAYIDFCRKQELMAQGVNEQTAAAQIEVEKNQAAMQERNAEEERQRQEQERIQQGAKRRNEERTRDMNAFIAAYPNVKPESIPPQVWAQVAKGESLMSAYTMHRNQELEAQITAERQNQQNRQRTPGSLNSGLDGSTRDEIDKIWYADD
ncbi:conserved hypothetical protein [uncultured Eubacteriales bacterium]|uniref:Uncharacterized protein n=1 Tax=uncultured Eubacteriales bacterium TaxID=172733 RepID=A0A212JSF1_9FIRM|nr:conserved hypothetical protein [uncultured Eubacteriales bacterium]